MAKFTAWLAQESISLRWINQVIHDIGPEAVIAAMVLRQAFIDFREPSERQDVEQFLRSGWFSFLAAHLQVDAGYCERVIKLMDTEENEPTFTERRALERLGDFFDSDFATDEDSSNPQLEAVSNPVAEPG